MPGVLLLEPHPAVRLRLAELIATVARTSVTNGGIRLREDGLRDKPLAVVFGFQPSVADLALIRRVCTPGDLPHIFVLTQIPDAAVREKTSAGLSVSSYDKSFEIREFLSALDRIVSAV